MTAKQTVRKMYPKAFVYINPQHHAWLVYSGSGVSICGKCFGHVLGHGWTSTEAWKNAAGRIAGGG